MANQTNAIAPIDMQALADDTGFDQRKLDLIKKRYFVEGGSDEEFALFMTQAARRGLDPTRKHIYAVSRNTWNPQTRQNEATISHQVSIDGQRLIAERTGQYEGQTQPQWCGPDGQWREVWLEDGPPAAARVGVYRRGFREPIYAIAKFDSFVQTKAVYENGQKTNRTEPTKFWKDMPDHMIAKVAEAQALRRAFPEELGGIYTAEEMGQASNARVESPHDDTHIEVQGRAVDRATGEITGGIEQDAEAELKAAKKALWVVVHNGYGWTEQDLELVVADRFDDAGLTSATELTIEQCDILRKEVQELTDAERNALIAQLRKDREAAA